MTAQRALELPVRMGMATGDAELRDGDCFGTVLNRAGVADRRARRSDSGGRRVTLPAALGGR